MRRKPRHRPGITARLLPGGAAVAVFLLGGCLFDSDGSSPSLAALWPNADGTRWDYSLIRRELDGWPGTLYPTREAVPPIPSMQQIVELLSTEDIADPVATEPTSYFFEFDGLRTTESGATGQRVVTGAGAMGAAGGELVRRLREVRPDLRDRLDALAPPDLRTAGAGREPLFLHGYAWEKTDRRIGGYGDLSRELSWLYLEADVRPGHEFTLQLVPDLTDDVFLHGLLLDRAVVTTPAGTFRGCVVCLYVVDYGVSRFTNDWGGTLGYVRTFDCGTIAYAAGVGPVHSYERFLLATGSPPTSGVGDLTLEMTAKSDPE